VLRDKEKDMTKQDRYDQLVSEIKGSDTITDISRFADYTLRDNLLCDGVRDEDFSKTILIKITNTVKARISGNTAPTQDDLEAIATAHNLAVMWELANVAVLEQAITKMVDDYKLSEPSLVNLSRRIHKAGLGETYRKEMSADQVVVDVKADLAK
jgi:hypothetical protein